MFIRPQAKSTVYKISNDALLCRKHVRNEIAKMVNICGRRETTENPEENGKRPFNY
jgi:hypothetical protein